MRIKLFLILLGLLFLQKAVSNTNPGVELIADSVMLIETIDLNNEAIISTDHKRPHPILLAFRKKREKDKKVVAAILAFPFPFGLVGLHRIYLGCPPYVPVIYIATAGGVLGILPFIDFCVLLLDKDIDRYINNKKIFMWVN